MTSPEALALARKWRKTQHHLFKDLTSQLDEEQKQRALINGAASPTPDEMGDGLVARNRSSERDGSSSSQGSPHNPLK